MPVPRQRLLLTLLDGFGGDLGNLDFQKLLFLYMQECEIVCGRKKGSVPCGYRKDNHRPVLPFA